jgi:hypothetical protein
MAPRIGNTQAADSRRTQEALDEIQATVERMKANAKPAPPQEPKCRFHPTGPCAPECVRPEPTAPPQDAEPVDFETEHKTAKAWAECGLFEAYGPGRRALARAYLALRDRLAAIEAQAEDATEYVLALENRSIRGRLELTMGRAEAWHQEAVRLSREVAELRAAKACEWTAIEDKFRSACNGLLFFEYLGNVKFCPFCGGKINVTTATVAKE